MCVTELPAAYKTRWGQASYTASRPGTHAIAWAADAADADYGEGWPAAKGVHALARPTPRATGERMFARVKLKHAAGAAGLPHLWRQTTRKRSP